jgi:hypothetical protein
MDVRMPDGTIVTNVPDNITQEELLSAYSSYTPPPVSENPVQQGNVLDSNSTYINQDFKIYALDGCEYIVVAPGNSHFTWGSHKGDCKNPVHQCCDNHYSSAIDTTEKHFDCTVESIEDGDAKNKYMYTTECGLVFYSNQKYKVGQTLKNFESPKHK